MRFCLSAQRKGSPRWTVVARAGTSGDAALIAVALFETGRFASVIAWRSYRGRQPYSVITMCDLLFVNQKLREVEAKAKAGEEKLQQGLRAERSLKNFVKDNSGLISAAEAWFLPKDSPFWQALDKGDLALAREILSQMAKAKEAR